MPIEIETLFVAADSLRPHERRRHSSTLAGRDRESRPFCFGDDVPVAELRGILISSRGTMERIGLLAGCRHARMCHGKEMQRI